MFLTTFIVLSFYTPLEVYRHVWSLVHLYIELAIRVNGNIIATKTEHPDKRTQNQYDFIRENFLAISKLQRLPTITRYLHWHAYMHTEICTYAFRYAYAIASKPYYNRLVWRMVSHGGILALDLDHASIPAAVIRRQVVCSRVHAGVALFRIYLARKCARAPYIQPTSWNLRRWRGMKIGDIQGSSKPRRRAATRCAETRPNKTERNEFNIR